MVVSSAADRIGHSGSGGEGSESARAPKGGPDDASCGRQCLGHGTLVFFSFSLFVCVINRFSVGGGLVTGYGLWVMVYEVRFNGYVLFITSFEGSSKGHLLPYLLLLPRLRLRLRLNFLCFPLRPFLLFFFRLSFFGLPNALSIWVLL